MKAIKFFTAILVVISIFSFSLMESDGYDIGDKASDFALKNVDGKVVSLADYKEAKGFIITFTCNHCPYSVLYEDRLIALDKKYSALGYPVIAINPNNPEVNEEDSYENMIIRAKQKEFTFPYLIDENQKIYPKYGAQKTPHVYVLKKENKDYIVSYIGAIDNNSRDANAANEHYVADAVDALLNGKTPKLSKTKAIGCSIKK